jgi:hypothetical protein
MKVALSRINEPEVRRRKIAFVSFYHRPGALPDSVAVLVFIFGSLGRERVSQMRKRLARMGQAEGSHKLVLE